MPLRTDGTLESSNNDGIYKYNAFKDAFDLFIKFDETISYNCAAITYDSKTNKLYIFQSALSFYIIDINTESITAQICTIKSLSERVGIRSRAISSNDGTIHLIGGSRNEYHVIWNQNTESIEANGFPIPWPIAAHGLFYLQSTRSLIVFGGRLYENTGERIQMQLMKMLSYSICDKKWSEMESKLPCFFSDFGFTITNDERYILVVGGMINDERSTNIYVFDIKDCKWYLSRIESPICAKKSRYIRAAIIDYEKLVHGYLRNEADLPRDIVELIVRCYGCEYLHLMDEYGDKHWCILVDHILCDLKQCHTIS